MTNPKGDAKTQGLPERNCHVCNAAFIPTVSQLKKRQTICQTCKSKARAEKMRLNKIASLKKQLEKLEKMKF